MHLLSVVAAESPQARVRGALAAVSLSASTTADYRSRKRRESSARAPSRGRDSSDDALADEPIRCQLGTKSAAWLRRVKCHTAFAQTITW